MNEKQFRSAVQMNTRCGKKALDIYCMGHGPEYTDEEYNKIIKDDLKLLYYRKTNKPIMTVNDLYERLTCINDPKKERKKK